MAKKISIRSSLAHFFFVSFVSLWFQSFLPSGLLAQEDKPNPLKIQERLWLKPGPAQDSPGAPKLLVVYPTANGTRLGNDQKKARYAGRVEPIDAEVLLDGKPVKVYPGGVFTGLFDVAVGEREAKFTARAGGKSTSVSRTVVRSAPLLGPMEWPLAFHPTSPVDPSGTLDYWLRPGSKLNLKLYASPGHHAWVRVGDSGSWIDMAPASASPAQGGAYTGAIPAEVMTDLSTPLEFKLSSDAKADRPSKTINLKSRLTVKRLPSDGKFMGTVDKSLATFLKNPEPSNWDRFGNFIRGVPFPVIEKLGERVRVDFGKGGWGYVETEYVKLKPEPAASPVPSLGQAAVSLSGGEHSDELMIDWKLDQPFACVFAPDGKEDSQRLMVRLIGAQQAVAENFSAPEKSYFKSARVIPGTDRESPRVEVELRDRELWGYGLSKVGPDRIRLTVKARPDPPEPSPNKPLGGLRIMIDPGHGGDDLGALGPSGVTEADLNLVVSGYLAEHLEKFGATIIPTRKVDLSVSLDDRVDQALGMDPDLFISIHHNSVGMGADPFADHGSKSFYHYPHSIKLAAAVDNRMKALLAPSDRPQVLPEVFRVNRNVSPCPSILVECGFVCNPVDEILLRDTRHLEKMADAISQGILLAMKPEGAGQR